MTQEEYIDTLRALAVACSTAFNAAGCLAERVVIGTPEHKTFQDAMRASETLRNAYNAMRSRYIVAYPNGPQFDRL